jgi:hypothetical protein
MSEQNANQKDAKSSKGLPVSGVIAASAVAALAGLAIGTLAGGPEVGIALAVIWGAHTAVIAATGYEVQPTDLS